MLQVLFGPILEFGVVVFVDHFCTWPIFIWIMSFLFMFEGILSSVFAFKIWRLFLQRVF